MLCAWKKKAGQEESFQLWSWKLSSVPWEGTVKGLLEPGEVKNWNGDMGQSS